MVRAALALTSPNKTVDIKNPSISPDANPKIEVSVKTLDD